MKNFLDKEDKIKYSIAENKNEIIKEINIKKDRYKLTNKELDFTIIELLEEDNINYYLEINKYPYKKDDKVFSYQYSRRGKIIIFSGKNIKWKVRKLFKIWCRGKRRYIWLNNNINE